MDTPDGMTFLAASLAAAASITFLALILTMIGERRRALRNRLRARRVDPRQSHGVSPVANTAQVQMIGTAPVSGRVRRWMLKHGFDTTPQRLAGLIVIGICVASGLGVILGLPVPVAIVGAMLAVPMLTLVAGRQRIVRRMKRAEDQFPAVIGTIVRSLRSGLTLQDAIQLVASEGPEPLRSEFARVLTDEAIGLPLPDACHRMAARLPFDAAEFFALIVAIQTETGGSIVAALQNLAETIESRSALADKIVVSGQEARASATIIGSLPVVVLLVLWMVQPDFVSVLFLTLRGQIALAAAALMVVCGTLVMREMARFDD